MLNETTLEKLTERIVARLENANAYVLKLIGEQIARIGGMTPTNAHKLVNLLKYGGQYDKIVSILAEVSDYTIKDIHDIFEEVAKSDYLFAKEFYEYRDMKYIPYEKNKSLQEFVKSLSDSMAKDYLNLSSTLGFRQIKDGKVVYSSLRDTYTNAIDEAILNLSQGTTTYQEMMRKTVKDLGESGIRTVDWESGYSRRLDSTVRMNIQDGILNLHNELQERIGKEVQSDGVEVSHHVNSAPDHINSIDGKQFTREEFEKLQGIKGEDGLYIGGSLERPIGTMNCRHYYYAIIMGISKPRYTKKQLNEDKKVNKKGFKYQDKHYTNYEGTQLMRKIETEIRKQKDVHIMAKASGDNDLLAQAQLNIRTLSKEYKNIADVSGLPTKIDRLRVDSYKMVNLKELNK